MTKGRRLRVLYVLPWFYPAIRYGGPIESVLRTCQALQSHVDIEVVTTDMDGPGRLDVPVETATLVEGVRVRYFNRLFGSEYGFSPRMWQFLRREMPGFDLAHIQPAFSFAPTAGCAAARMANLPYVVSPRGTCQPWARGQKRWKRLPYWHLIEQRNLSSAAALHATSVEEETALRQLFPRVPILLVPNGVQMPSTGSAELRSNRRVLFLGRLHPIKALDRLLHALSLLTKSYPDVEAVFAGPDDVGEWNRLKPILAQLNPRPNVRYVGPVHGERKSALLSGATLLALPSHMENFGQVVVEALSYATPVVVSRHTPWAVVEKRGAGHWVDNDASSMATAMADVLADPARARKMGEAALSLAKEYSWTAAGDALASAYEGIVARSDGRRGLDELSA